ncbi:MAG: InlB B-repeat-containing protein, partial [Clostridia bacterium]|nr:InlB B-repeat-containing protein [Clostridia bacterium]
MKRVSAFVLSLILLLTVALGSLPVNAQETRVSNARIRNFESDTFSVIHGEDKQVVFTASVESEQNLRKTDVAVYDENGEFVTYMLDDGRGADKKANDGIFTGTATLSNRENTTVNYYAQVGNRKSASHPIKYRNEITEKDFQRAYNIWDRLEAYENELAVRGMSAEEIADAVYDFLVQTASSEISSIKRENEKAFSFVLKSGIENYFEHYEDMSTGTDYEKLSETVKSLSYIESNKIGVWSPYYGFDSNFTTSYRDRANVMKETADFAAVDAYYGEDASIESFKHFDEYGVVMIDSHGADYNGGGYICIPAPGEYDIQDAADGHIVLSGDMACLRGTYIQKYCDPLPGTVVYVGICYGMAANNLYQPLLNCGAEYVCGFNDSVTFYYDNIMMNSFCEYLVSQNPSASRQYTAGEAFDAAVIDHGDTDPYGTAVFINKGNPDVVATPNNVSVEDVYIHGAEFEMYTGNTHPLTYSTYPVKANRHSGVWTSDNPDVISVTDDGMLTVHEKGKATITLTVTDNSCNPPTVFKRVAHVEGLGEMPVSGIYVGHHEMTLYKGVFTWKIDAHVLPKNATNQSIIYTSKNDYIASVDQNGVVTPVSVGQTEITVSSADENYSDSVTVTVLPDDINGALNVTGGNLEFESTSWDTEVVGGRFAARSTNHGQSSEGVLTMTCTMNAGDTLLFDYKTSTERDYDKLLIYVSGSQIGELSGEIGWSVGRCRFPSAGTYTVTWKYVKDSSVDDGDDCVWLDNVRVRSQDMFYTVTFLEWDGSIISTQTVEHGYGAEEPANHTHLGYTFVGWDNDFSEVTSNMTVTAQYEINSYTVNFCYPNGEIIATDEVTHGSAAQAPENTELLGYTFTGWDKDFSCVTGDMTVWAQYDINVYTVLFKDWNGSVIGMDYVNHGDAATAPQPPMRTGYTFTGWDNDFTNVTADMTVTAQYAINTYTVTFIDHDGAVLATDVVEHGEAAQAPENPTREGYTFTGWDKDFTSVTEDMTVTAQYTVNVYTLSYYVDGELYEEVEYAYGAEITPIAEPTREGYTFSGWSEIPGNMPANDVDVYGTFVINTYTVTFIDHDGTVIATQEVEHGGDAEAPENPTREGYTFTGWDKDFTSVTEDMTVTAQYTVNVYTLSYYVDGELYEEVEYAYGAAITPIAEPTREGYTFSGWSAIPENMPANDVRIDGTFDVSIYTVTFVDSITGETISTATVQHGSDVTLPEAPVHEGYTFTGWDADGTNITADTTITAQYEADTPTIKIGDVTGDGNVNTGDAVMILKYAAGLAELDEEQAQ